MRTTTTTTTTRPGASEHAKEMYAYHTLHPLNTHAHVHTLYTRNGTDISSRLFAHIHCSLQKTSSINNNNSSSNNTSTSNGANEEEIFEDFTDTLQDVLKTAHNLRTNVLPTTIQKAKRINEGWCNLQYIHTPHIRTRTSRALTTGCAN